MRSRVLARDGYACQIKGPRCQGQATTADHVVPVALGGVTTLPNLRATCAPCNQSLGGRIGGRMTMERRLGRTASRAWFG